MNILFISRWFPYPPDNGSRIRIFNLIKGLARHHTVDLVSFFEDEVLEEQKVAMGQYCRNIELIRYQPFRPSSLKSILGFFSLRPRSVIDTYQPAFAKILQEATARRAYDLLIFSEIDMAVYGFPIRGVKKILDELEITKISNPYYLETRPLRKLRLGLTWWKLAQYVRTVLKHYDGSTVVSELEQAAVRTTHADKVPAISPNGVDVEYFTPAIDPQVEPDTLLYNGAITYSVNFEAVAYFIREVFPLILAERPGTRFFVTGKIDRALIDRLPKNEQVVFTGYLKDIRTVLRRCCVNVIPILTGGGTRLKILEGLAAGLPVVSTSAGAEGLNLEHGREILIADSPEEFARAVLSVLGDAELREYLRRNGRKFVENHYDWRVIVAQFESYLAEVTHSAKQGEKA